MTTVLVTGAMGNVGREVVRAARASGLHVRAGVTDEARSRRTLAAGVELVRFDYSVPATYGCADGADCIFLMRPPSIANVKETLLPFVDRARRDRDKHIVFLSVAGAERNKLVPHHAVEQYLQRGRSWTILRPGFFAQNFGDAYRRDIVEQDRVFVPAGAGRVAFVDVRDVAEVVVKAFLSPGEHDARAYTLTGGEAVTLAAAAAELSIQLGRPIRYEPASIIGYAAHLRRRRLPWAQIGVQTVLHVGLRFGQAERVDPTLERLLERPSRSLPVYFRDHHHLWQKEALPNARS